MSPVSTNNQTAAKSALTRVCNGFHAGESPWLANCVPIARDDVPAPFDLLLAHTRHMTTTLGSFHGREVSLRVLREQVDDDHYAREILLTLGAEGPVVEYGIARVNFAHASPEIRAQVLEKRTPLGDILIAHDVLRTIRPRWFFRFPGDAEVATHFGPTGVVYGRVGTIYFEDAPAIELLEVVVGERRTSRTA
jgi:chorismate-pyruvate lyase